MLTTLSDVAKYVSGLTGLSEEAIMAQMIAEVGHEFPANNNFANILFFGDVGQFGRQPWEQNAVLGTRLPNGGWLIRYNTAQAGADAYVTVLLDMSLIRFYRSATWYTHTPESDVLILAASPWDGGHYGGNGVNLFDALTFVETGESPAPSTESAKQQPVIPESQETVEPTSEPSDSEVVTNSELDYTVQPGDTLWGIVTKHLAPGSGPQTSADMWAKIWAIVHATYGGSTTIIPTIHPGDVLKIPVGL